MIFSSNKAAITGIILGVVLIAGAGAVYLAGGFSSEEEIDWDLTLIGRASKEVASVS